MLYSHIFVCVVYIMVKIIHMKDVMSVKVFILQVAVLNNSEHLVQILLDSGADPNIQNQVRSSYNQHRIAVRSNGDFFLRCLSWKTSYLKVFICSLFTAFLSGKKIDKKKISFVFFLSLSLKIQLFLIKFCQRPNDLLYELCYTHSLCFVNIYFIWVCFYFS